MRKLRIWGDVRREDGWDGCHSLDNRYNPLQEKKQIFCAKIWLQARSEKAAEPRNHQDFGVNQPDHKISTSFPVMDS